MRVIDSAIITETVRNLFIDSNYRLPDDARALIELSYERERPGLGKAALECICKNLEAASRLGVPICQDTGMAVVFAEVGQEVYIKGGLFDDAVNEGVRRAYLEGYLRCSVADDPLFERKNTGDNTPAVIYVSLVAGDRIKLTAAPKGFGSENMSVMKMLNPSATKDDIIAFVVGAVKKAGGNPCPPILVGVGLGSTFEGCALLAKKALVRPVSRRNANPLYAALEGELLAAVNTLGIGAQGFGGDITAFAVNIEYAPTHIAGLPAAVNINCHAMRHAEAII